MSSKNNTSTKTDLSFKGKFDPVMDAAARDRIIGCRVKMLLDRPFFGSIASRLKLVNADTWCDTAATDGAKLYYNSRFIMHLQFDEVVFLVAHEVLHAVYDHLGRIEFRDPNLSNIAADYAVNRDAKKYNIGKFITTVPCLYDKKYDDMSYEEIYEHLYKNANKIDVSSLLKQLLDDHLDDDSDEDGNPTEETGGRPKLTKQEREEIKREMKAAIISAAQTAGSGVPPEIARMIEAELNPTMPWREMIASNISSLIKVDYSWSRPSRRSWHLDAIMPAMIPGEEIDVAVAIDMSGSITDEQAKMFLSEIHGIMTSFDGFKIHVFCFDTSVHNPQNFNSEDMDTIAEYQPVGGGGTEFPAIFDHLRTLDKVPSRLIVFTDGYPNGSWGDETLCDVTWVIHGNTSIVPPFGQHAYFD